MDYNLRKLMLALIRDGYARPGTVPPDLIRGQPVTRQMKLHCLNKDCGAWATVNYAARSDHGRTGLYNCPACPLSGDAISLVLYLCGEDFHDPDSELSTREDVGMAHVWAKKLLGIDQEKPVEHDDDDAWVPPWVK